MVYFVTGGTNSGQDVLEVVFSKPNRERQKLMREQNILKQVGEPGRAGECGAAAAFHKPDVVPRGGFPSSRH